MCFEILRTKVLWKWKALFPEAIGFLQFVLFLKGDTFTYEDVEKNVLRYLHDGSSAREDSMEISVTDGLSATTVDVTVEVSPDEAWGPQLAAGASLSITVASQSTAVITRSHLAYVVSSFICLSVHCSLWSGWLESDVVAEHLDHQVHGHKRAFCRLPYHSALCNSDAIPPAPAVSPADKWMSRTSMKTHWEGVRTGDLH